MFDPVLGGFVSLAIGGGTAFAAVLMPRVAPVRAGKVAYRARNWRYAFATRPPARQARLPRPVRIILFFPLYGMAAIAVVSLVLTGETWTWRTPVWVALTWVWTRQALRRRKGLRLRTARELKRRAGDSWRGYA